MTRTSSKNIITVLKQRLNEGRYVDNILPSERDLSSEFGVARLTVRRALESMLSESLLRRLENGRLILDSGEPRLMQVGYFYPSLGSWDYEAQYQTLSGIANEFSMKIRPIYYDSWSDSSFTEGVDSVDAVILHPRPNIPEWLVHKLQNCGKHICVVGYDYSKHGFPSFTFFPDHAISKLMDYLHSQGHYDMDLINITPKSNAMLNRIEIWQKTLDASGGKGRFWDFSLADGHLPFCELRDIMRRRIQEGMFDMNRLILATTVVGATVFQRAAADLKLFAGKDYSLASIGSEMHAEMNVPAITSVDNVNPYPYFRGYLQWLASGKKWEGELFWKAESAELITGESVIKK